MVKCGCVHQQNPDIFGFAPSWGQAADVAHVLQLFTTCSWGWEEIFPLRMGFCKKPKQIGKDWKGHIQNLRPRSSTTWCLDDPNLRPATSN